ncbi:MAG: hypothetical protein IJ667_08465 [Synergistaceae bacterium]|nr:hypothetical protein [Synergistaceae bacterium]
MGDLTPFVLGVISIALKILEDIDSVLKRKMEQFKKFESKIIELVPDDRIMQNLYNILLQASLFTGHGTTIKKLLI